jgi:hypothetical protein
MRGSITDFSQAAEHPFHAELKTLHDQRFPVHSASSSDSSAQSTPLVQMQAALVLAQDGQRAAAANARSAHAKFEASEQLLTAAKELAARVDVSNAQEMDAVNGRLAHATTARERAACDLTLLLAKTASESEMFRLNCAWLVAKIEDLETGQQDLSAASDQELQKLREDLSQQREAAVALTLENDRLGLALDRVEGELEYLEEHQGDDVRQLEVQVGEGAAAVEAAAAQRAILQKELNNATYKLARASRMKDRLAALPDRVKEELVRLMVKNQVSLDDFNSECLKLLKFVPPETALELLQAFFLGRDFGSRATSENLVCVVLFEAKVITKLLCMLI